MKFEIEVRWEPDGVVVWCEEGHVGGGGETLPDALCNMAECVVAMHESLDTETRPMAPHLERSRDFLRRLLRKGE